jgi:hypothetical protein
MMQWRMRFLNEFVTIIDHSQFEIVGKFGVDSIKDGSALYGVSI